MSPLSPLDIEKEIFSIEFKVFVAIYYYTIKRLNDLALTKKIKGQVQHMLTEQICQVLITYKKDFPLFSIFIKNFGNLNQIFQSLNRKILRIEI